MIYFTSDLHFSHQNIIKYCSRPFESAEDMNNTIISNWNTLINKNDEVYILGDITLKRKDFVREIIPKLKGKKYLIKGNHDHYSEEDNAEDKLFEWVKHYHELYYQGTLFVLTHFPFLTWHKRMEGSLNLHGHIHAQAEYNTQNALQGILRFDVGLDANCYFPISIQTLLEWTKINPDEGKEDYHYKHNS